MKRRTIAYCLLVTAIIGTLFFFFGSSRAEIPEFESVKVQRGLVNNAISVSGRLEPETRITLAFPSGGRIAKTYFEEGSFVLENTTIAELESELLESSVSEAVARVAYERALLKNILSPLRTEERALKDIEVVNAEEVLERAEKSARVSLTHAFVLADNAIHGSADEIFSNKKSGTFEVGIHFTSGNTTYYLQTDATTEKLLNIQRKEIEEILTRMKNRANNQSVPVVDALSFADQDLHTIQEFLTTLAKVVNRYSSNTISEQSVYETFQNYIASARDTINVARSEVSGAHSTYVGAEEALSLVLQNLKLADAGATKETIVIQEAAVLSAQTMVQTARERAKEAVLKAPTEGVLTRVNFEKGETVQPFEPFAEIINEGEYLIEAYIPEADIARLVINASAEVTFDAFEKKDVFKAEVVQVEMSETIRDGVPTYKTTLQLVNEKKDGITLRPSMTADVEINVDSRKDVLYVPSRCVINDTTRTYVKVFNGTEFIEKDVVVGLRGSDGTVEIVSGLLQGEEVVIFINES